MMTPERLAYLKAELGRSSADDDYYTGGLAPAAFGLELLAEVERLRAQVEQQTTWARRVAREAAENVDRLRVPLAECQEVKRLLAVENGDLRAEALRLRAELIEQKKRHAKIAWRMEMEFLGGGTAIGNAIQDSP